MLYLLLLLCYISNNLGKLSMKRFQRPFQCLNINVTNYHDIFKKMVIIPYELESYEIDMFLNNL
jgi:hypothetical protein